MPKLKQHRRRGLAPLELVAALPLLLFVMALLVVFGAMASWKVRTAVAAREGVWQHRWPRTGQFNPRPDNWPQPYAMNHDPGGALSMLDRDAYWLPVIRGPLPGNIAVRDDLFDPIRGQQIGHAHMRRNPSMLAKLGSYRFDVDHPLLDDKWQYRQMGIGNNRQRRLPFIYDLPTEGAGEQQFWAAFNAIVNASFRPALLVLDRDEEFRAWYGGYREFHPRLRQFCSLDQQQIYDDHVLPLIDRIEGPKMQDPPRNRGVATTLTNAFLRLYRDQLRWANQQTPPPQGLISQLEAKIKILEAFLAKLQA